MTINFYNPSYFSFEENLSSCYWFLQSFLLYTPRVKIAALFQKYYFRDHPTSEQPPLSYLVVKHLLFHSIIFVPVVTMRTKFLIDV